MKPQQNRTLEILKLFASYMVVFIHIPFYGTLGTIGDALARFAVPLFFVVSGFFSYQISLVKIKTRILHVFRLTMFATTLYTIRNIANLLFDHNIKGLYQYLVDYLNPQTLANLFVFNVPRSSEHLWFLFALTYVYIIFYFVTKHAVNELWIFKISLLCLFIHLVGGELFSVMGIVIPIILIRNFILMGIPFFGIGLLAKKYEQEILKTPVYIVFISLIIGVFTTLFSRNTYGKNELYIGSLFILFSAVIIFIKYSTKNYPSILDQICGCSTYVYILHIIVGSFVHKIYLFARIDYYSSVMLKTLHPLMVCFASTVIAYCIKIIQRKLESKFSKVQ